VGGIKAGFYGVPEGGVCVYFFCLKIMNFPIDFRLKRDSLFFATTTDGKDACGVTAKGWDYHCYY
jgi:hypothetical protein